MNNNLSHEARELILHADNTQHMANQQNAFVNNMKRHMKAGKYDSSKGQKLWSYYADRVAQDYHKTHGSPNVKWHQVFSPKHRKEVAAHFEDYYRKELSESTMPRTSKTLNEKKIIQRAKNGSIFSRLK